MAITDAGTTTTLFYDHASLNGDNNGGRILFSTRHHGGLNMLWADWHVTYLSFAKMKSISFNNDYISPY